MLDSTVQSPVMTLEQSAAYLHVSKAHLSNVINGKVANVPPVRCFRVGRRVLIQRESLDSSLESERVHANI
jgi:Helix-turn-helix domain